MSGGVKTVGARKRRLIPGQKRSELFWWAKEEEEKAEGSTTGGTSSAVLSDSLLSVEELIKVRVWRQPTAVIDLLTPPEGAESEISRERWILEHMRQVVVGLNHLLSGMPECTDVSYPQMKSNEEVDYMCSAHHRGLCECSAMQYSAHTLDHLCNAMLDIKKFPDRFSDDETEVNKVKDQTRRLYRILLFAYHYQRELFDRAEHKFALYSRLHALIVGFQCGKLKGEPVPDPDTLPHEPSSRAVRSLRTKFK